MAKSREQTDAEKLRELGRGAVRGIVEMVAALEVDYDRLEELRNALREVYDEQAGDKSTDEGFAKWCKAIAEDDNCGDYYGDVAELAELEDAAGECGDREDAERRIHEDALSVEVRSDWHTPGGEDSAPSDFRICLCTGGPAIQIVGELDEHGQPTKAWVEAQDWFLPWTRYNGTTTDEDEAILTYCQQFYFGEG